MMDFFSHISKTYNSCFIIQSKSKEQTKNISHRTQELDLLLSISAFCHPPKVLRAKTSRGTGTSFCSQFWDSRDQFARRMAWGFLKDRAWPPASAVPSSEAPGWTVHYSQLLESPSWRGGANRRSISNAHIAFPLMLTPFSMAVVSEFICLTYKCERGDSDDKISWVFLVLGEECMCTLNILWFVFIWIHFTLITFEALNYWHTLSYPGLFSILQKCTEENVILWLFMYLFVLTEQRTCAFKDVAPLTFATSPKNTWMWWKRSH